MLKGFTTEGLGRYKDLENQVLLAAKNKIDAVDTSLEDLKRLIADKGERKANEFLEKSNVKIGAIQFPVDWRNDDEAFYSDLPKLLEAAKLAKAFDCKVFNTFFMPSTDENVIHHLMKLTKRIRLCAEMIQGYDCNIALEFVGPYHMRKLYNNEFIWDLSTTLDWISLIDKMNVGILLDSIHWHTSGGNVDDILALEADQIIHVHINDAPDLPKQEILDNDRLYPGEGIIDLVSFLKALKEIGYKGVVSQEVITLIEPEESSEFLAEKSGEAMDKIFKKAGLS